MTRARLALLLLACAGACAPVVTHGPRVEPGTQIVVTGGAARPLCDDCTGGLLPQISVGMRGGHAATELRAGFSMGVHVAANVASSEMDAYVQAPRRGGWDAGAGLLLGPMQGMPYVQLGRMGGDGSGLYTTQGLALHARHSLRLGHHHPQPGAPPDTAAGWVRPRYWAPTLAFRGPGRNAMHMYLSGAFGTAEEFTEFEGGVSRRTARRPVRMLVAGFVYEFGR
ncbi:MAG: hypothetical protein KY467_15890 [Gemmatimonadetes bacterium]|nr:hypothetical protein [Gemmatimonadota bacterium]